MAVEDVKGKVLVTGGGGLIGSKLVRALLKRGYTVRALDIHPGLLEGVDRPQLEFVGIRGEGVVGGMVNKDIVKQAVENVEVVYHLAIDWDGHTWRHTLPIADLLDVNIRGTLNLLEEARSQAVKHFIFSSSTAVYGQPPCLIADEETVCKPETWEGDTGRAYGVMKFTTERLCLLYNLQFGLPVTVFRIDYVFDDDQALPSACIEENLRRQGHIEVIEGDGYAAIHVDDVVRAFLLVALNKEVYGQVLNLSNPDCFISYRELYQLLIPLAQSKAEVRLTSDPTYVSRALESNEKIQRILGWKPEKGKDDLLRAIARSVKMQ